MHFVLEENRGANPLLFGVDRNDIRRQLSSFSYFTKADEPENDFYESEGFILGYDDESGLEFIEIIPPSTAEFRNFAFFKLGLTGVLKELNKLGFSAEYDDGGYDFCSLGIALYCPQNKLESVSLYREGYYD
jgi:hypothetical protein